MNATPSSQLPSVASLDAALIHYPSVEQHRATLRTLLASEPTPLMACDPVIVQDRLEALQRALRDHWGPSVVGYSFKTNYLLIESGVFDRHQVWAEVVSAREYALAERLGFPGNRIIYNGPYKDDASLRAALTQRSLVNVNDHDELTRVISIANDIGPSHGPCEIGIRVTSDLPRLGMSRFGFSLDHAEAHEAARRIEDHPALSLVGLHTHLYGDTDDAELYGLAAKRMADFAVSVRDKLASPLKFIDMGGGYPAHSPQPKSRTVWQPQPIDVYVQHIAKSLGEAFPDRASRPTLIMEPGRYLTCDGILLVTRVVHVKQRGGKQVAVCDGSISMVPLTHYCPQIIRAYTPELTRRDTPAVLTSLQGATCRENDSLYEGPFCELRVGDYLVHYAAGAYNSSLCPNFIFAAPSLHLLSPTCPGSPSRTRPL